ncbi:hypothetical protein IW261DRAFT_1616746 [Armillaria novae-zelandiae]|uniref:Uncharacterized protein n=1 Tax=Armillaria novae-zelandiae TaxID=153914 RepID=A0AA39PVH2_9AGAR|nr:hypothetical protein IW261DRAFT_1616746 [Armillaria novae-zelandiae]
MALSIKAAEFVAIIVESVLYGFAALLIFVTLWALTHERNKHELSIVTFVGVCALALLSTLHLVADGIYVYRGFIASKGDDAYFLDSAKFTFKNTVYFLETLLADGILIYRCYIVWQNVLVIAFPILGWIGTVGAHTIWSIAREPGRALNNDAIFVQQTGKWVVSFYSVALATNISATFVLATKLWIAHRRTVKYFGSTMSTHTSKSSFYPIILVIVECGALYSLALIAMLTTYLLESNAAYLVIDLIGQIIPITFSVILLRAALARYQKKGQHNDLSHLHFAAFVRTESQSRSNGTMKVNVKSYQETDGDRIQVNSRSQDVDAAEGSRLRVNGAV